MERGLSVQIDLPFTLFDVLQHIESCRLLTEIRTKCYMHNYCNRVKLVEKNLVHN